MNDYTNAMMNINRYDKIIRQEIKKSDLKIFNKRVNETPEEKVKLIIAEYKIFKTTLEFIQGKQLIVKEHKLNQKIGNLPVGNLAVRVSEWLPFGSLNKANKEVIKIEKYLLKLDEQVLQLQGKRISDPLKTAALVKSEDTPVIVTLPSSPPGLAPNQPVVPIKAETPQTRAPAPEYPTPLEEQRDAIVKLNSEIEELSHSAPSTELELKLAELNLQKTQKLLALPGADHPNYKKILENYLEIYRDKVEELTKKLQTPEEEKPEMAKVEEEQIVNRTKTEKLKKSALEAFQPIFIRLKEIHPWIKGKTKKEPEKINKDAPVHAAPIPSQNTLPNPEEPNIPFVPPTKETLKSPSADSGIPEKPGRLPTIDESEDESEDDEFTPWGS